jgi:DNA polymerase I-like protein with 3'-5' exonuclease and polymerase domains
MYGLELMKQADQLVGHNTIAFDFRALAKVYPGLKLKRGCDIVDTLILSRVLWPELEPLDSQKFGYIEPKYKGRHSLAAWGERLGTAKIKFQEDAKKDPGVTNIWENWTPAMQKYCEGDTLVSLDLYKYFLTQPLDKRCHELEHEFAKVMARQEDFGFPFNEKAAFALVNTLKARRAEINDELQQVFPPITEERISAKTGRVLTPKVTTFNPASRQQTADRLQERYPEITFDQTDKGNVKLDDDVLEILGKKYPEAKLLAEYQLLNKRLGQITEGKEAWLKHSQAFKDSRIHGAVITNACISGRCSHKRPNMAQVPSVGHTYGAECRALFHAPDGYTLVGADASGLELRALGAWLAHFDGGEYAKLVSTDGFDIHTYNAKLFGIFDGNGDIPKATRDLSKRLIYALLYGAGAKKVGSVIDITLDEFAQSRLGRKTIETFYQNLPAIKQLKDKIDERITLKGYLVGIDGRRLQIRSRHSALNQLLQSTGAVSVKKATVILYQDLIAEGLKWGKDFAFVAHIHDEIQAVVKPEHVEVYKKLAIDSFRKSGEYFNLLCPFTGEAREGKNWMETH